HELPREFVYTTGLPRNQAGKILRSRLTGSRRSVPFGYDQPADDTPTGILPVGLTMGLFCTVSLIPTMLHHDASLYLLCDHIWCDHDLRTFG
ncbi:MAG: hypothetical protein AAF310_03055, partial [Myxococcota bacterium]